MYILGRLFIFTIIPGVVSFFIMRKENASVPEGQIDETPLSGKLYWLVFVLDFLAPLVAQAVFYYGWQKRLPHKARTANQLGWLSLIVWIGILFLLRS